MPIFNFKCTKCGKEVEILVLPQEKEPTECPYCGGELEKVYRGSVGLSFKGSGFYITDYVKKSKEKSHSSEKGENKPGKEKHD